MEVEGFDRIRSRVIGGKAEETWCNRLFHIDRSAKNGYNDWQYGKESVHECNCEKGLSVPPEVAAKIPKIKTA